MSETTRKLATDKSTPGHWRVTLNNPPINVIDDGMYDAFYDLVGEVAIKNEMEASVTLALDVKTEAAGVSTHTVGALGVVSESVPGKLEVGAAGVNINNGAFTVI